MTTETRDERPTPAVKPYTVVCEECEHRFRTRSHHTCLKCGSADLSFHSN